MLSSYRSKDDRIQYRAATFTEMRQVSPEIVRFDNNFDADTLRSQSEEERR